MRQHGLGEMVPNTIVGNRRPNLEGGNCRDARPDMLKWCGTLLNLQHADLELTFSRPSVLHGNMP